MNYLEKLNKNRHVNYYGKDSVNFDLITYKDIQILTKYLTEQGKIRPRRITKLSSKQHKKITRLIKIARIKTLLPFVTDKG